MTSIRKKNSMNEAMKNALRKLELHLDSAMPCKMTEISGKAFSEALEGSTRERENIKMSTWKERLFANATRIGNNTVLACLCEAHELTKKRIQET